MKKYISFIVVAFVCLFTGMLVSYADYDHKYDLKCEEDKAAATDLKKFYDCKFVLEATSTTTLSASKVNVTLTYVKKTALSNIKEKNLIGDLGYSDSLTTTDTGGSFVYYLDKKAIEKGKTYVLAEFLYEEDRSAEKCGVTINTKEEGSGGSGKGGTGGGGDNPDTGFSIPVAVIGVGTVAGLTIYSVSSKKTKFRRI